MAPLIACRLDSTWLRRSHLSPTSTEFTSLVDKLRQLVFPFSNYILPLDIATAAWWQIPSRLHRHRALPDHAWQRPGTAVTTIGFVVAPWAFKGTYFLDTRFVIYWASCCSLRCCHPADRLMMFSATCLLAAVCHSDGGLGSAGHEHQSDIDDLRAVIASVPPGARVIVAEVTPANASEYWRHGPLSRRLSVGFDWTPTCQPCC